MKNFDNYEVDGQMTIFDFVNSNESPSDSKDTEYSINKPIRLIELFGGVGSQAMALERLGADFEHYRMIEFDKYAVASYNSIHGTDFKVQDVTEITADDLGIVEKDKYCYLLTYSFPCFTKDTLITTSEGLKKISDVKIGDCVLTHTNQWQKVTKQAMTGVKPIYRIKAMGIDYLDCTENHKFYVRKKKRRYPTYPNGKRGNVRYFDPPEWVECKDLDSTYYLGIAIPTAEKDVEWNGIQFIWGDGRKSRTKNQISSLLNNNSFWWLIGRYLGDGWCRKQGGIIICCAKNKENEIIPHILNCGFNFSVQEERTTKKIHIPIKELEMFVRQYGYMAYGKKIPGFMYEMKNEYIKSFIEGYFSADGYKRGELYSVSSVSKELIYGVATLVAKAYKTPYQIYYCKKEPICIIENRLCNQRDSWELRWKLESKKSDKAFYQDGYIWTPIRRIEDLGKSQEVYDITVENDHSFCANGVIAHNCVDLSVAGYGQGFAKGSGTRSSLLWEVERLIEECGDNLPDVLVMENVIQVHSKSNGNIKHFEQWLDFLSSKGYKSIYQDINANTMGVPQSRNRCFCVSILGDYDFEFPKQIEPRYIVEDYLEPEEDCEPNLYISDEKLATFFETLIEKGKVKVNEVLSWGTE